MSEVPKGYVERWPPIESNPRIFTSLAQNIGLSRSLAFKDVWALDSDTIALLPRPVYALVLVFPTDDKYDETKSAEDTSKNFRADMEICWFQQTIYNACGLYGLIHAVSNGEARKFIASNSVLSNILHSYTRMSSTERSNSLLSPDLKYQYLKAAQDGDSIAPGEGIEVDFHYTCFVKSSGHLVELDGDLSGPVDRGAINEDDDMASEAALATIKSFMDAKGGTSIGFSMLALVPTTEYHPATPFSAKI